MSEQNINLNQLGALVNGINIAQKRGAYTLQESAQLAEPVVTLTRLLEDLRRQKQEQLQQQEQPADTSVEETNNINDIKTV